MRRRNKIIYWGTTVWLAVAMVASGVQQIFSIGGFVEIMKGLGYPPYFSAILGVWKMLAVLVILLPKLPLWKEWAYAGLFFAMSGAFFSHIAVGQGAAELSAPLFLLILTLLSWYLRPAERKLTSVGF
jgi:hypothetical protein